jgi:hypothetical protein
MLLAPTTPRRFFPLVLALLVALLAPLALPPAPALAANPLEPDLKVLPAKPQGMDENRLRRRIVIDGNRALSSEVYYYVIERLPGVSKGKLSRRGLQEGILRFLRRTGYLLATVKVQRTGKKYQVHIDEGRLEKIIFSGRGTFRTIQLKLAFNLPNSIFNSYQVEEQLMELSRIYRLPPIRYRLVPKTKLPEEGFQLDKISQLPPSILIPEAARWDLYIDLKRSSGWDPGSSYGFTYDTSLGAQIYWSHKDEDLLVSGDRWRTTMDLGLVTRRHLDTNEMFPILSRGAAGFTWFTPDLGLGFRPLGDFSGVVTSDQRRDMDMDIYLRYLLTATISMSFETADLVFATLGTGIQRKSVFGIHHIPGVQAPEEPFSRLRPLVLGNIEFSFDRKAARSDRRHHLNLDSYIYMPQDTPGFARFEYLYERTLDLGWHDLWLASRGVLLTGHVEFDEDQAVGGSFVRAVFVHRYYVSRVANLSAEFRYSLLRDVYKLSLFHDLAAFGQQNRLYWFGRGGVSGGSETFRLANSGGLGFHALLLDTFQFNLYLAAGYSSEGLADYGFTSSFVKVF